MPIEPAVLASEGRMPRASEHGATEGQDALRERPATWHGQPRARAANDENSGMDPVTE
jgi:hypothetical protein